MSDRPTGRRLAEPTMEERCIARVMSRLRGHDVVLQEWHRAQMIVAAVMEEMMRPTKAMVEAGRRDPDLGPALQVGSSDCDVNPIVAQDKTTARYQAMIFEAMGGMDGATARFQATADRLHMQSRDQAKPSPVQE